PPQPRDGHAHRRRPQPAARGGRRVGPIAGGVRRPQERPVLLHRLLMVLSPPSGSPPRFAILMVASVTLIVVGLRDVPLVRNAREGAAKALDPVQNRGDEVARPVRDAWHGVTDYDQVKAENERLRARVADAESQKVTGADAEKQLADLSKGRDP